MQPENVSKQINKRLFDAEIYGDGMLPPRNMTQSRIRKSATTGTRKSSWRHEKEVAVLMAHDVSTANKHYNLVARQAWQWKDHRLYHHILMELQVAQRRNKNGLMSK